MAVGYIYTPIISINSNIVKSYNNNNEHAYSEKVKAGKRTYFFDIKQTRGGDYYLVITESKKDLQQGQSTYKKNKLFLYKEEVNKFVDALERTTRYMKEKLLPDYDFKKGNNQADYQEQEEATEE